MARAKQAAVYPLKVTMSPPDYPDAEKAGEFHVVLRGDHLVTDLCDIIEQRTGTDYCDSYYRFHPSFLDMCEDDAFGSLGLNEGDGMLFSGYAAFDVTVVSISRPTRPLPRPYILRDTFDTDWSEELLVRAEREHWEELQHGKAEANGAEPPAADHQDLTGLTTDYRSEWDGEILEQATGRLFIIKHKSREDELPRFDMLEGIISVGGTDQRMPIGVGLLHLLGPEDEIVRTLDCRERMTWGAETFESLGIPPVRVDDGTGDAFDAYIAEFEARGRRDEGFSGRVRIRVYSNAEFWKRKLRNQRV